MTATLIFLPVLLFFSKLHLREGNWEAHALPGVFLTVSSLFWLFRVGCTDPGIVARNPENAEEPEVVEEFINGVKISRKFCTTCHTHRPSRAKHCAYCNNCVKRFDHHCPWVSNCVGQRNYFFFVFFIVSAILLSVYVFIECIYIATVLQKQYQRPTLVDGLWESPVISILVVYALVVAIPLTNLACFHFYLILVNQTTNEMLTRCYEGKNPFFLGWWRNCKAFWCQPADASVLPDIQEAMVRGEVEGDLPPVTVVGRSVFDLPMDAVV